MFDVIAFDADDTLWHNEDLYAAIQGKLRHLLAQYQPAAVVDQTLYTTEMRNLSYFGYGIKSFTLSMIETAIEISEGRIQGQDVQTIIHFAREMLNSPVQLFEQVEDTVADLSTSHTLMLITKGDLLDQQTKLARSGLAPFFSHVEIVSDKTGPIYAEILARYRLVPSRFLMVGNSLRSDILPVVAVGGQAVYIPYHNTWLHERVEDDDHGQSKPYFELEHIGQLPALVSRLSSEDA